MNETTTLKTLQLFYAGLTVDAVRQYGKQGVLEAVTESKRREQEFSAPEQLARLGITRPEEIFSTYTRLFGCADWRVECRGEAGASAPAASTTEPPAPDLRGPAVRGVTRSCLACALAKKLGAPAPCAISCINPLRAQAAALDPPRSLEVEGTLWEGDSCIFTMRTLDGGIPARG